MKNTLIKFNIQGQFAFFKNHINRRENFSYPTIHKPAILGMLGAILGLNGFSSLNELGYIEYIRTLSDKVSVSILKKEQTNYVENIINDSTCLKITTSESNVIQQREHFLSNPNFDVYLKIDDNDLFKKIHYALVNKEYVYYPNLGKSYLPATITNIECVDIIHTIDEDSLDMILSKHNLWDNYKETIFMNSLFPTSHCIVDSTTERIEEDYISVNKTIGEFMRLPTKSNELTGKYIENEEFTYSNFVDKNMLFVNNSYILTQQGVLYFV